MTMTISQTFRRRSDANAWLGRHPHNRSPLIIKKTKQRVTTIWLASVDESYPPRQHPGPQPLAQILHIT